MGMRAWRGRVVPIFVIAGQLVFLAGCSGLGRTDIAKPVGAELSSKLHPFVYYEQGSTLFLAVDVRAAQFIKEGEIYPVGLGLANFGRAPLTFGKEAFVVARCTPAMLIMKTAATDRTTSRKMAPTSVNPGLRFENLMGR